MLFEARMIELHILIKHRETQKHVVKSFMCTYNLSQVLNCFELVWAHARAIACLSWEGLYLYHKKEKTFYLTLDGLWSINQGFK